MITVDAYIPKESPKIAIVGDFPDRQSVLSRRPFAGEVGRLLNTLLTDAGIVREDCLLTYVFNHELPHDELDKICASKKVVDELWQKEVGHKKYPFKAVGSAKYVLPKYLAARERLWAELNAAKPTVIIALGNIACWALFDSTGISKMRGTVCSSPHVTSKIIPTYHPAAILAAWDLRTIALMDINKAKRETEFPEIRKPSVEVWTEPTLADLYEYECRLLGSIYISCDIETSRGQITCIGFAPADAKSAIVVPFYDTRQESKSYWPTLQAERAAWEWVRKILGSGNAKLFQNGMYDLQYLARMGFVVRNFQLDTMVLHHSLYCEMDKSLGFLGSIYTDFPSWKFMRPRGKHAVSTKSDDE